MSATVSGIDNGADHVGPAVRGAVLLADRQQAWPGIDEPHQIHALPVFALRLRAQRHVDVRANALPLLPFAQDLHQYLIGALERRLVVRARLAGPAARAVGDEIAAHRVVIGLGRGLVEGVLDHAGVEALLELVQAAVGIATVRRRAPPLAAARPLEVFALLLKVAQGVTLIVRRALGRRSHARLEGVQKQRKGGARNRSAFAHMGALSART